MKRKIGSKTGLIPALNQVLSNDDCHATFTLNMFIWPRALRRRKGRLARKRLILIALSPGWGAIVIATKRLYGHGFVTSESLNFAGISGSGGLLTEE